MHSLNLAPSPSSSEAAGPDLNGLNHAHFLLTGDDGVVAIGFVPESATLPYVSAFAAGSEAPALAAQAEMLGLPCWEASSVVAHILACDPIPGAPIPAETYGSTGAWLMQQKLLEHCNILDMYVLIDLPRRPALRN